MTDAHQLLDARGLNCPLPITAPPGNPSRHRKGRWLRILATDPVQ